MATNIIRKTISLKEEVFKYINELKHIEENRYKKSIAFSKFINSFFEDLKLKSETK